MLVHRVASFGALAALLASYCGIYYDAFKTVGIPMYVVNIISSCLFLICAVFPNMRSSIFTSSIDVSFETIEEFCACSVRLVLQWFIIPVSHTIM